MSEDLFELNDETCELLDLYVAGALEDSEVKRVKAIISHSPMAQKYVDEARGMFAHFEDNSDYSASLLMNIKSELGSESNKIASVSPIKKSMFSYAVPFLSGAAAASIIAIIAVSVSWPDSNNSTSSNRSAFSMEKSMEGFQAEKGTVNVSLTNPDGNSDVKVMMHDQGDIMVDGRELSTLDPNSTYQLWAVVENATGQQVISVGVLGNEPGIYMARVSGDIKAFAITKEVSGGVEKSSHEAMYSASVA